MREVDDVLAIRDRMVEMEREAECTLAAQKMAAGDDTHNFRASLIEFYMRMMSCDNSEAKRVVDNYLYEQKGRWFLRKSMRRKRKV
jgi:hypothetical protein